MTTDKWEAVDLSSVELSSKVGVRVEKTHDNKILILGGVDTQYGYQTFHSYDPETGTATALTNTLAPEMPI